jgi:hypothetical protein
MEMPQIIIIGLVVINVMVNLVKNGDSKQYSFVATVLDSCILLGLLVWGGFFG